MKRRFFIFPVSGLALVLAGCGDSGASDQLLGQTQMSTDPESLAAGAGNTVHHFKESVGGDNGIVDERQKAQDDQSIGSPEVVARLHAVQKLSYESFGELLTDLGVNLGSGQGAGALYMSGGSALGMPIYANRVPEMIVPSTSSLAKMFDIFSAAAPEIVQNAGQSSKRCPGVMLFDTGGQITADGIACLTGKPALPEHVTLANQLVTQASTPQIGQQIAVATLLAAAHTSE